MAGEVAIVTGAAQGIGRATALRLGSRGYRVAVVDLQGDRAADVARELAAIGVEGEAFAVDVGDAGAVDDAAAEILLRWGRVDALVNNAGLHIAGKVVQMSDEDFDRVLRTNLKGIVHFSRAVVPSMIERRRGGIVNTSSVWAWGTGPEAGAYAASKAGVTSITKTMALELGEYGIRVNAVAPGLIDTEQVRKTVPREHIEALIATHPLKREGTSDEVAGPICFLLSDDASWINGETVTVSGGILLR